MRSHGDIRDSLYDFVMNDLDAQEAETLRAHLLTCEDCRAKVEELKQLTAVVPRPQERPSDHRDEAYWTGLAARIERGLPPGRPAGRGHALTLRGQFRLLMLPPRPGIAFALVALALAVTATPTLRPWEREEPVAETAENAAVPLVQEQSPDADIAAHLRRSRNLLVGLANDPDDPGAMTDLSIEREASRRLLEDNRRYRSEVLDPQSSEVLADLEKIMIEVANSREQTPAADLDLIRQGIRQQNLLFKVRMAEQLSSRGMIVRASGQMMREE